MEENEKEVFEVEPIETKEVSEENKPTRGPLETAALTAFILCCIGCTVVGGSYFGSISAIVLNAIALNFNKKAKGVSTQPYSAFWKIVSIAAVIGLVVGIIVLCATFTKDMVKLAKWIADKASSSNN